MTFSLLKAQVLLKAAQHKYTHRKLIGRDPKTNRKRYRYYYAEHHGGGITSAEIEAGSAFKLTFKGRRGHFHVQSVEGDTVTVKHDGRPNSKPVEMTKAEFRALLKRQHETVENKKREKAQENRRRGRKKRKGSKRTKRKTATPQTQAPEQTPQVQEPEQGADNFETMPEADPSPAREQLTETAREVEEDQQTQGKRPEAVDPQAVMDTLSKIDEAIESTSFTFKDKKIEMGFIKTKINHIYDISGNIDRRLITVNSHELAKRYFWRRGTGMARGATVSTLSHNEETQFDNNLREALNASLDKVTSGLGQVSRGYEGLEISISASDIIALTPQTLSQKEAGAHYAQESVLTDIQNNLKEGVVEDHLALSLQVAAGVAHLTTQLEEASRTSGPELKRLKKLQRKAQGLEADIMEAQREYYSSEKGVRELETETAKEATTKTEIRSRIEKIASGMALLEPEIKRKRDERDDIWASLDTRTRAKKWLRGSGTIKRYDRLSRMKYYQGRALEKLEEELKKKEPVEVTAPDPDPSPAREQLTETAREVVQDQGAETPTVYGAHISEDDIRTYKRIAEEGRATLADMSDEEIERLRRQHGRNVDVRSRAVQDELDAAQKELKVIELEKELKRAEGRLTMHPVRQQDRDEHARLAEEFARADAEYKRRNQEARKRHMYADPILNRDSKGAHHLTMEGYAREEKREAEEERRTKGSKLYQSLNIERAKGMRAKREEDQRRQRVYTRTPTEALSAVAKDYNPEDAYEIAERAIEDRPRDALAVADYIHASPKGGKFAQLPAELNMRLAELIHDEPSPSSSFTPREMDLYKIHSTLSIKEDRKKNGIRTKRSKREVEEALDKLREHVQQFYPEDDPTAFSEMRGQIRVAIEKEIAKYEKSLTEDSKDEKVIESVLERLYAISKGELPETRKVQKSLNLLDLYKALRC